MKPLFYNLYYRNASDQSVPSEEGGIISPDQRIFVEYDPVSGPYSPSNPKLLYNIDDGPQVTGGQMVRAMIHRSVSDCEVSGLACQLKEASFSVNHKHQRMDQDPLLKAVAGACVAGMEIGSDAFECIVIGDCGICFEDDKSTHFITNFDAAAVAFEKAGDIEFARCRELAEGNIAKAWDLYYPYFCQKQYERANRNRGKGGHSMLNGDLAFSDYWTTVSIPFSRNVRWMTLFTDGMVPPGFDESQKEEFAMAYRAGGVLGIEAWRKRQSSQPHIGEGKSPEGSMIELCFV